MDPTTITNYDGSHCRPLTTASPVDTPLADRCVTAGHSTPIGCFMSSILSQFKLYFINCPDVESEDSSCAQRLFTPPSDVSSIAAILYAKAADYGTVSAIIEGGTALELQ